MPTPDPRSLDRRRRAAAAPAPTPRPPDTVGAATLDAFLRTLGCDPARMHHVVINRGFLHVVEMAVDERGRRRRSGGEPVTERRRILIDRKEGDS